jgi:hypothetical protein
MEKLKGTMKMTEANQRKPSATHSDNTHYNKFLHPNLIETPCQTEECDDPGWVILFFRRMDDIYIRPMFVYKYLKRKKRMYNFEIGDVLREYRLIQEELDE